MIRVRKLLRVAVKGFEVERFLLVKGDDFGKWSSVVLTEHLTLPLGKMQKEKMLSQLYPQARWPNTTGENYSLILCGYTVFKSTNPTPSSVVDFQRRVIGKGARSAMENSRTLNAGDKIAHCIQSSQRTHRKSR